MIIINIDESSSMDISETFRPEDLSKTDFFDFVTAPDMGIGIGGIQDRPTSNTHDTTTTQNDQSLQDYDQFWSSDKDPSRLDAAIFEDLDRYCWQQQHQHHQTHQSNQHHHHQQQQPSQHQTSSSDSTNPPSIVNSINQQSSIITVSSTNVVNGPTNNDGNGNNNNGGSSNSIIDNAGGNNNGVGSTDGQIYTLTVLNGNESWLKRDSDNTTAPTLDLDSILGNFPAYVKSEFPYDDSSFSTDNSIKDELGQHSHAQQGSIGIPVTSVVTTAGTSLAQFQNNNNDWQIADNNTTEQNSAESLLRSALQGKGYSKGSHLQNGVTLLPNQNTIKDEELRRALFSTEQENLSFVDSALATPVYDDTHGGIVSSPVVTHQQSHVSQPQSIVTTPAGNNRNTNNTNTNHSTTTAGIIVDDMFLSLETAFTDDFEKIKRIANEVQQFCSSNDYPEVIMEITTAVPHATQPIHVQPPSQPPPPPPPQPLQPEVTTSSPLLTSSATKTTAKKYKRSTINNNNSTNSNNNNTSLANNNNSNSTTHCNGQRKERSLHYCSICSKGFKDKYSVNVHIRTHTGEKPFACSLCGKSFRQKAHLAKHYQTHLAQKSNGNVTKGGKSQSSNNRSTSAQQQLISSQTACSQVSPNTNTGPSLPPANGLLANR